MNSSSPSYGKIVIEINILVIAVSLLGRDKFPQVY